MRLVHNGVARRVDKPSAEVEVGDALVFPMGAGSLISVRVEALAVRRGPPAEARALYSKLDAEAFA